MKSSVETILKRHGSACLKTHASACAIIALSLLLLAGAVGCQILGATAYVLQPPAKSEAKFKPTTRALAVFVDDQRQAGNASGICDSIAALAVEEMREHKVGQMVDVERIHDLRLKNPKAFATMKIDEVGKSVGAEQIIYVDMIAAEVNVNSGGQLIKGKAEANVRVVDCKSGRTLWPTDLAAGYHVGVESPYRSPNESNADLMNDEMIRAMAGEIAKLFYTYTIEE